MRDGGYPLGAEYDRNAPYNQPVLKLEEIEVDVIVTMSLRTKIKVDDYDIEEDWDDDNGKVLVNNYENCNLFKAVEQQLDLPNNNPKYKDWVLDDMQVYPT